jgi:hypothetical protein
MVPPERGLPLLEKRAAPPWLPTKAGEREIIRHMKPFVRNLPPRYLGILARRPSRPEYIGSLMNQFQREQGGALRASPLARKFPKAIEMPVESRQRLANLLTGEGPARSIPAHLLQDDRNLALAATRYLRGVGPDPYMKGSQAMFVGNFLLPARFGSPATIYQHFKAIKRRYLGRTGKPSFRPSADPNRTLWGDPFAGSGAEQAIAAQALQAQKSAPFLSDLRNALGGA